MSRNSVSRHSGESLRRPELDWIKALAILTVVMIHCLPPFFAARVTSTDLWLSAVTRFAVPGFLFVSGFLYAGAESRDWFSLTRRRLKRLLIPYLLLSLFALAYPIQITAGLSAWDKLLFGAALGEYYYIFVFFWLILATPLVAQIPRSAYFIALLGALFLQWGFEAGFATWLTPFWSIRNPIRWMAYFMVGWCVFENRFAIQRVIEARRWVWLGSVGAVWVVLAYAIAVTGEGRLRGSLVWIEIYASLGLIFAAAVGSRPVPFVVRWLSDVSYSIYLSHLFFVDPMLRAIPRIPGIFDPLRIGAGWAAGLAGGIAVSVLARALLGERRARTWLG